MPHLSACEHCPDNSSRCRQQCVHLWKRGMASTQLLPLPPQPQPLPPLYPSPSHPSPPPLGVRCSPRMGILCSTILLPFTTSEPEGGREGGREGEREGERGTNNETSHARDGEKCKQNVCEDAKRKCELETHNNDKNYVSQYIATHQLYVRAC